MDNFVVKRQGFKGFILDLVFPKECLVCGQEGRYLCSSCFKEISLNKKFYCALCHKEFFLSQICPACQKETALNYIWVAADYNNEILQSLIHNFKYNYIDELSSVLVELMIKYTEVNKIFNKLNINSSNTVIVAVPLHKKRFLKRGFNQSELLADKLAANWQIKKIDLLVRKINTASQVNMNRQERRANLKEAFTYKPKEKIEQNKNIILVDDVITTGSTLNECAKILQEEGFKNIYGLVIAQRED